MNSTAQSTNALNTFTAASVAASIEVMTTVAPLCSRSMGSLSTRSPKSMDMTADTLVRATLLSDRHDHEPLCYGGRGGYRPYFSKYFCRIAITISYVKPKRILFPSNPIAPPVHRVKTELGALESKVKSVIVSYGMVSSFLKRQCKIMASPIVTSLGRLIICQKTIKDSITMLKVMHADTPIMNRNSSSPFTQLPAPERMNNPAARLMVASIPSSRMAMTSGGFFIFLPQLGLRVA